MLNVQKSNLILIIIFSFLVGLLFLFQEKLVAAHVDGSIQHFSSDAAQYYLLYTSFFLDQNIAEALELLLISSPIVFLILSDGNLILVLYLNIAIMFFALYSAFSCLPNYRARMIFLIFSLIFPYFLFGFLSLNKEIYAMCSAIFLSCYFITGGRRYLFLALLLAFVARYYLFVSLIVLIFLLPRLSKPRYYHIAFLLIAISILAPVSAQFISTYSSTDLLDVSGVTGIFFSSAVNLYGYAVIYPLKYIVLIPSRILTFILDWSEPGNAMQAFISVVTMVIIFKSIVFRFNIKFKNPLASKFILAGLIAPIPMMWSEIMHWRYYSFTYFFFLFAFVIYDSNKRELSGVKNLQSIGQ